MIFFFHLGMCLLDICHGLESVRLGNTNTEAFCCRDKTAGPEGNLGWLSLGLVDVCCSLFSHPMEMMSFHYGTGDENILNKIAMVVMIYQL